MTLLEEIREISQDAARQLEEADCCTDADIRTLSQSDLQELLPGFSQFKVRKKIYEAIHQKRPIHIVLNELKSFVPDDFLTDALCSNGPLHEYLQMLKELKVEITHIQEFLDAHINLLENYGQNQLTKSSEDQALVPLVNHPPAASSAQSAATNTNHKDHFSSRKAPNSNHKELHSKSPKDQVCSSVFLFERPSFSDTPRRPQKPVTVTYKMVVSGKTLNSHLEVMGKLKSDVNGSLNLEETESDEDAKVIIVFCPVVSRAGTDVEIALQGVSGVKPVILVIMHHSRNAQTLPTIKTSKHSVMLTVNVFFHETLPGLLKCTQNDEAIVSIQNTLKLLC